MGKKKKEKVVEKIRTAAQIKVDLAALEVRLKKFLVGKDRNEIAEMAGTFPQHISGIKTGKLQMGYKKNKLLNICEKLGL